MYTNMKMKKLGRGERPLRPTSRLLARPDRFKLPKPASAKCFDERGPRGHNASHARAKKAS